MRYIFDNDLHIHSHLSLCSGDPEQTPERILRYAAENKLKTICLTDHYWDDNVPGPSNWYARQNFEHISQALPLPCADGIRFLFGCETELREDLTLGISPALYDTFDFIIIPTTHLHMDGFTCRGDESSAERALLWKNRFDAVLDMDLPFYKVGIAHLTCDLMNPKGDKFLETLSAIPEADYARLFRKAAEKGVGIELNFSASAIKDKDIELLPYRVAKAEGCKFYFGSDAHHPKELDGEKRNAEAIIDLLDLAEEDKFILK